MACSCKNKIPVLIPAKTQTAVPTASKSISNPVQNTLKEPEKEEPVYVQYTYTTTTQPLDSCPYCAQKHLSTAAAFILQGDIFGVYQAAGQLLLASYHLPHYPQTVTKLRKLSRSLIDNSDPDFRQHFNDLIPQLQSYLQNPKQQIRTELPDITSQDYIDAIIHAAAAYQLLREPYYQLINKTYAIGQLCVAAMIMRKYSIVDGAVNLRKAWKLLQQVKTIHDPQYQLSLTTIQQAILARLQA